MKQHEKDIDVYLEPLIDDLKLLWEEVVEMFDAYLNEMFNFLIMWLCTTQDILAYGNLFGYTIQGEAPCLVCDDGINGSQLESSRRNFYLTHHFYLPYDHSYRR